MTQLEKILEDLPLVVSMNENREEKNKSRLSEEYAARFEEFAEGYANSNEPDREIVRNGLRDKDRLLLMGLSEHLAFHAKCTRNKRWLFVALIAHSIEDFRFDYRENILSLNIIRNEIIKMGEDPKELFEKVALLSSANVAGWLRSKQFRCGSEDD